MNVFSRIRKAIERALDRTKPDGTAAPVQPEPSKKNVHMIRVRPNDGRPIKGPAFLPPTEGHHVSRQTCRAALRAIQFHHVSTLEGTKRMSRKDRRRLARLFACLEYRRMMQDDTNAIPDEAERIYRSMTANELAGAA